MLPCGDSCFYLYKISIVFWQKKVPKFNYELKQTWNLQPNVRGLFQTCELPLPLTRGCKKASKKIINQSTSVQTLELLKSRESYLHFLLQQRLQTRQESRMKHIIIRIKFKESAIKLVIELNSLHRVTKDPKRKISNHNSDPNVSHTSPLRFQQSTTYRYDSVKFSFPKTCLLEGAGL